jgi:hypothetical protein
MFYAENLVGQFRYLINFVTYNFENLFTFICTYIAGCVDVFIMPSCFLVNETDNENYSDCTSGSYMIHAAIKVYQAYFTSLSCV